MTELGLRSQRSFKTYEEWREYRTKLRKALQGGPKPALRAIPRFQMALNAPYTGKVGKRAKKLIKQRVYMAARARCSGGYINSSWKTPDHCCDRPLSSVEVQLGLRLCGACLQRPEYLTENMAAAVTVRRYLEHLHARTERWERELGPEKLVYMDAP